MPAGIVSLNTVDVQYVTHRCRFIIITIIFLIITFIYTVFELSLYNVML